MNSNKKQPLLTAIHNYGALLNERLAMGRQQYIHDAGYRSYFRDEMLPARNGMHAAERFPVFTGGL